MILIDDNKGRGTLRLPGNREFGRGFGGPSQILASQPGIVECPAAAVFRENETVS